MNEKERKLYKKTQNRRRWMQIWYGNKIFSMPWIYKFKNKAYMKEFHTGYGLYVGYDVFLYRTHALAGKITIGNKVHFSNHVTIDYSGEVILEDRAYFSNGVKLFSHAHDCYEMVHSDKNTPVGLVTRICKGAWIGAGATIMGGVTIGEYAVVGADSVVTHDVPANTIYAGNPARYIRDNVPRKKKAEMG